MGTSRSIGGLNVELLTLCTSRPEPSQLSLSFQIELKRALSINQSCYHYPFLVSSRFCCENLKLFLNFPT
ncbi:hypothetical protein L1887_05466 [Cichorium endivia]|nr:hypothetical protein L1887_05466 [Cichorium endivia]